MKKEFRKNVIDKRKSQNLNLISKKSHIIAKKILQLDCVKNAKTIKEVAKACPLDRLLVETDDPYLTPVPYRGQENKPSYVYYVVQEIASLRETSFEEIENASFENARKVFHL